jgi:uncharacterized protein involved in exopolysaccharide biosynthesis
VEDIRRVREAVRKPGSVRAAVAQTPGARLAEQELAQVKSMLAAKRRALADLEDFRRRRLVDLDLQLTEQRRTYADAHPLIVSTRDSIAALEADSPQMAALRREERDLREEYTRRSGRDPDAPPPAIPAALAAAANNAGETGMRGAPAVLDAAEAEEYAHSRLRIATNKYEDLLTRIDSARIELDTARAAFKYRYSVVTPAQVPKKVLRPKPATLLLGGLIGGLFLALFCSVAADLSSRRLLERWQLERTLGLPVLGELKQW